jgi:hypothetical protein
VARVSFESYSSRVSFEYIVTSRSSDSEPLHREVYIVKYKWCRRRRPLPSGLPSPLPPMPCPSPEACKCWSPALFFWRWLWKCMPRCACAAETTSTHCRLPPSLSSEPPPSMVFPVFSSHAAYIDSITVRRPALDLLVPRDPLAFSRGCLEGAPMLCVLPTTLVNLALLLITVYG